MEWSCWVVTYQAVWGCIAQRSGMMGQLSHEQVPLWFCVACPAVLGLLAPLVINAGLGALADTACRHWQLPAEECNDLWCVCCCMRPLIGPRGCAHDPDLLTQ